MWLMHLLAMQLTSASDRLLCLWLWLLSVCLFVRTYTQASVAFGTWLDTWSTASHAAAAAVKGAPDPLLHTVSAAALHSLHSLRASDGRDDHGSSACRQTDHPSRREKQRRQGPRGAHAPPAQTGMSVGRETTAGTYTLSNERRPLRCRLRTARRGARVPMHVPPRLGPSLPPR